MFILDTLIIILCAVIGYVLVGAIWIGLAPMNAKVIARLKERHKRQIRNCWRR